MHYPLIICSKKTTILDYFRRNYIEINLNIALSAELIKYPVELRPDHITDALQQLIREHKGPALLTCIEIMFNPKYRLNVVQELKRLSQLKQIAIIWPGEIRDSWAVYSETGKEDYYQSDMNESGVIYIV